MDFTYSDFDHPFSFCVASSWRLDKINYLLIRRSGSEVSNLTSRASLRRSNPPRGASSCAALSYEKIPRETEFFLRRGRDLNSRGFLRPATLAVWCLQPLGHLSITTVEVRFELTVPCGTPVFKTGRLNHFRTPPFIITLSYFKLFIKAR